MVKRERELRRIIVLCGLRCIEIGKGSRGHYKITVENSAGQRRTLSASMTPSDSARCNMNFKTDLKRAFYEQQKRT